VHDLTVAFSFTLDGKARGNVGRTAAAGATSKHRRAAVQIFLHNEFSVTLLVVDRIRREATAAGGAITPYSANALVLSIFDDQPMTANRTAAGQPRTAHEAVIHGEHMVLLRIINSDVEITTKQASA